MLNETDSLRPKNMAYLQTLITFHNTSWTYGASFIIDKTKRVLTFLRYQDDYGGDAYSKVRYSCDDYGSKTYSKTTLKGEIPYIKMLWESLKGKIEIDLNCGFIGSPEEYEDVLKTYVDLFAKSNRLKYKYGRELSLGYNTDLFKKILPEGNVFQPFDSLLRTYGFTI